MPIRPRFLRILAGALALAVCARAAAEEPAAAAAAPTTTPAANKIWECTTQGVRTFSSNPCGTKPTVRELNPINVMEPAPMYRVTHSYAPPTPAQPDYATSDQAAGDANSADTLYNAYPGYVVVTRSHRGRPHSARSHPRAHH